MATDFEAKMRPETQELHGSFQGVQGLRRRGASYIWLSYSIFFFIEPLFRRSLRYWMECLGILAVFFAAYVVYVEIPRYGVRLGTLVAMFALGVATIHFNPGASYMLIFVAALLPFTIDSLPLILSLFVVESLVLVGEWWWFRDNPVNYTLGVLFIFVVGGANVFVAEQKRTDCRLRAAQEENAALAAVAERERIARDLHDVLGHTLSVIVLKAELAGRLVGLDDARACAEISDVERTARTALAEVREAIGGYRTKGLPAEVEQARRILEVAGVDFECACKPPAVGPQQETVLSLAIREAVTNIVRHARATRCVLRFAATRDGFDGMTVEDDGRGLVAGEGNGLRGMRERVQAMGGRFRVESDAGTRVVVELPSGTA